MIDDLLGIPYKLHGRDKDGYDCYGLVIEVEKRFGRRLPDFYTKSKADHLNIGELIKSSRIIKTNTPVLGDLILFYDSKGRTVHIGVYLKNDDFIHCDCYGVRISKLSSYFRKGEVFTWQS